MSQLSLGVKMFAYDCCSFLDRDAVFHQSVCGALQENPGGLVHRPEVLQHNAVVHQCVHGTLYVLEFDPVELRGGVN